MSMLFDDILVVLFVHVGCVFSQREREREDTLIDACHYGLVETELCVCIFI